MVLIRGGDLPSYIYTALNTQHILASLTNEEITDLEMQPTKNPNKKNSNRNIPVVGSRQANKCEVPKGGALSGVVVCFGMPAE